jgi:hypothetical protein
MVSENEWIGNVEEKVRLVNRGKPDGWLDDYVTISAMLPAFTLIGKTLNNCLITWIMIMLDLPFNNEMRLENDQVRNYSNVFFQYLLFTIFHA